MSALLGQSGMKASNQELQSLLSTTLSLLDRFSQLYVSSEAFVEIVTPLASIVRAIREKEVSLTLQVRALPLRKTVADTLYSHKSEISQLSLIVCQSWRAAQEGLYVCNNTEQYRLPPTCPNLKTITDLASTPLTQIRLGQRRLSSKLCSRRKRKELCENCGRTTSSWRTSRLESGRRRMRLISKRSVESTSSH